MVPDEVIEMRHRAADALDRRMGKVLNDLHAHDEVIATLSLCDMLGVGRLHNVRVEPPKHILKVSRVRGRIELVVVHLSVRECLGQHECREAWTGAPVKYARGLNP